MASSVDVSQPDHRHGALLLVQRQRVIWYPGTWGPKRGWAIRWDNGDTAVAPADSATLDQLNRSGHIVVANRARGDLYFRPRPVRLTAVGERALRGRSVQEAA